MASDDSPCNNDESFPVPRLLIPDPDNKAIACVQAKHTQGQHDTSCYILKLPYELIFNILSLVLPTRAPPKSVHAVRSVCKAFRFVANQLPFWLEENFMFQALTRPYRANPGSISEFIEFMLQDAHLVECLNRKKSWKICGPDEFDALYRNLPSLPDITERLRLASPPFRNGRPGYKIPEALKDFKNLNYLKLFMMEPFPQLPSSIRTLVVVNVPVLGSPRNRQACSSLHQVENLCEFSYLDAEPLYVDTKWGLVLGDFLPLGSSATLSTLRLDVSHYAGDPDYFVLDTFLSVKTLDLRHCSDGFFIYLEKSLLQLDRLSLIWARRSRYSLRVMNIARVLQTSPALQKLMHLRFKIAARLHSSYLLATSDPERVIRAITTLAYLEGLELGLPIDAEWCQHFKNCNRLRSIEWTLPHCLAAGDCHALMSSLRHLDPVPSVNFRFDYCHEAREMEMCDEEASELSDDGDEWIEDEEEYLNDMYNRVAIDWYNRLIWDSDEESNDE